MKFIDIFKSLGLTVAVSVLAACGDAKIGAVQDSVPAGQEFSYGEILGKAKECSGDWTSEVVNNRTIVTYTCSVKLNDTIKAAFEKSHQQAMADLYTAAKNQMGWHEGNVTTARGALHRTGYEVESAKARLNELRSQIARGDESYAALERSQDQSNQFRMSWPGTRERMLADIEQIETREREQVAALQARVDGFSAWTDRYAEAIEKTTEVVKKKITAQYDAEQSVSFKVAFLYRENLPAQMIKSTLTVLGQERESTIWHYLQVGRGVTDLVVSYLREVRTMPVAELYSAAFPYVTDTSTSGYRLKDRPATSE